LNEFGIYVLQEFICQLVVSPWPKWQISIYCNKRSKSRRY